jgi:hypothetical protein
MPTEEQIQRIKELSAKGYSANAIQRTLQEEGLGMRRTVLLRHVRYYKGEPEPRPTERLMAIPTKYRREVPIEEWLRAQEAMGKRVKLVGTHKGKKKIKGKDGSGRELYNWIKEEMTSGYWDSRPEVIS